MARLANLASRQIYTVLEVKSYSGYYRSCLTCKRKLRALDHDSTSIEKTRYHCRICGVDYGEEKVGLCYCLIMTVTDYPNGAVIVSLFGRTLDRIFGLPASQMHKFLIKIEDEEHTHFRKALDSILIGACVELMFAKSGGVLNCGRVGQKREMSHCVATGMRLLGANSDKTTVFSLLSTQTTLSSSLSSLTAATTLSKAKMTQQNSTDLDSSSFLYDTKSQTTDTLNGQRTLCSPLKLESFLLETQSGHSSCVGQDLPSMSIDRDVVDSDVYSLETSEEVVRELETEWENTQQISQQQKKQLLSDFDLSFSEDVLSELQETFDDSMDPSSVPGHDTSTYNHSLQSSASTDTPLSNCFMKTDLLNSQQRLSTICGSYMDGCCGTPELFSSQKKPKLNHHGRLMRETEPSISFTPELFGTTPFVCRNNSSYLSSYSSTPLSFSVSGKSKARTPKRSLCRDSSSIAPLDLSHSIIFTSSQLLDSCNKRTQSFAGSNRVATGTPNFYTPSPAAAVRAVSQLNEHSLQVTVSSPDLFS